MVSMPANEGKDWWGLLPTGAVPCDMLFTDGYSAYIDSGIVPSASMSVDANILLVRGNNTFSCPIGYYIGGNRFSPVSFSSGAKFEIGYGGYYDYDGASFSDRVHPMRNYRVSVTTSGADILITEGSTTIIDDTLPFDASSVILSDSETLGLLGRKTSSSGISDGVWRGGAERIRLYGDANFQALVADYLPCYYNGNFGFWDAVSETHLIGNTPANIYGFGEAWNTKDFIPNAYFYNYGNLRDYRGACVSPIYKLPNGCTEVRFNSGQTVNSDMRIVFYDNNQSYKSYFTYNEVNRVVSVPSGGRYVRLAMSVADRNTCYIYDTTNNMYVWKGLSIQ